MLLFFSLVLFIPFVFLKKRDANDIQVLDHYSTTCVKGVLCLYVMLHNLGLDYKGNSEIAQIICEHTGGIGVGVFFFLSAFGIIRAYQKKGNEYLKKLLFKNIPRLYLISVSINAIIYFVFMRNKIDYRIGILKIFNLEPFIDYDGLNPHGWYIVSIIAMYLIFAIIYFGFSKINSERKLIYAGITLALVAIILCNFNWLFHIRGRYTRGMNCFALGCVYAMFYDKVNSFLKKYFLQSFIILLPSYLIGLIYIEPLGGYAACLIVICLSQRFTFKSKITHFLGEISLGVYLFLYVSSLIMQPFIENQYLWVISNAVLIFVLSIGLYFFELLFKRKTSITKVV